MKRDRNYSITKNDKFLIIRTRKKRKHTEEHRLGFCNILFQDLFYGFYGFKHN